MSARTVAVSAGLSAKARDALKTLARREQRGISDVVREAVAAWLDGRPLAETRVLLEGHDYFMPVAARLPIGVRQEIGERAKREGCSVAALMGRVIMDDLARRGVLPG